MPTPPESTLRYYRECAIEVIRRGYMCAGCLVGQYYCDVNALWRAYQEAVREDLTGIRVTWESDNTVRIERLAPY